MLPDRIHPDTGLDQGEGPDAVHGHLFVGVMGVLTDEFHVPFPLGFLDVFDRDVLFAVDVDREQVHVAPEDVADILELFVKYDVAAFEQRVHRMMELHNLNYKQAAHLLVKLDARHAKYYFDYTGKKWGDAVNYDLCINSASYGIEESVELIERMINKYPNS